MHIEFHADDYGMFPQQSGEICRCITDGVLNGVSIMPNSPYLEPCMAMLPEGVAVTIHLTLYEGKAMGGAKAPHLQDREGNLSCSFGKLLLISYLPFLRERYLGELKEELLAQIRAGMQYCGDSGLRLDGHGHYHMIPVVFDALAQVIRENDLKVSFIRIPEEDIALYKAHAGDIPENGRLNPLKAIILNTLAGRNRRRYPELFSGLTKTYFMGVYLSGHMSLENLQPLLTDAVRRAGEAGKDMEILFHPGYVSKAADIAQITSRADREFMTSEWRQREGEAVRRIGDAI